MPTPPSAPRGPATRALASSRAFAALVAAIAVASGTPAQSPAGTIPDGFLTREGSSRHWVPGHFAPSRAQTTYDASAVAIPTGTISQLWLRPDMDVTTAAMQAQRQLITLHIGSEGVPTPSQILPESYTANHGRDRRMVLDRSPVDFPAATPNGIVAPWSISLPIQPFPYVQGRHLQLEWDCEDPSGAANAATWFVDAQDLTRRDGGGWFRRKRARDACPSAGTIYDGEVGGPGDLCSIWFYSLSGPSLPATTWFGTSDTHWGTMPLPADLGPLGYAGCSLAVDMRIPFSGLTDPSGTLGRYRVDVPIPFDPGIAGLDLYTQTFVLDPNFGNGLRASDGGKAHIGNYVGRLQARHLYSYQSAPTDQPEFSSEVAPIVGWR
jgi:hypothetical protein